jgi:hypothetical protein
MMVFLSVVYIVVGIAFGEFASRAASNQMRTDWFRGRAR